VLQQSRIRPFTNTLTEDGLPTQATLWLEWLSSTSDSSQTRCTTITDNQPAPRENGNRMGRVATFSGS
jgi:hypothetical protein